MTTTRGAWIALAALLALGGNAFADGSNDDLRRELDALRRTVEQQARQIEELQARSLGNPDLQAAIAPFAAQVDSDSARGLRVPAVTKKGSSFELYGFIRVAAISNDSRAGIDNQLMGWILSEDPTAPPGVGQGGNDNGDFTIHTRLSRLGLDFDGGIVAALADAKVTGKVEIDFQEGGSQSRARLRMRKAYLNLAWSELSLLAGQTTDLISPLYASVNPDLAMWGAGNLGDRRPQIRLTYAPTCDDETWFFQGMLGQTGAVDASNFDGPGTFGAAISDGQKSGKPMLQGRVAYRSLLDPGKLELGVWGLRAWEDPDTRVGTKAEGDFQSSGWGVDVQVPLVKDVLAVKGEWFAGRNLDDVRGGIFQGINAITGEEISTDGGFVEVLVRVTDWMTWHVGLSQDDPDNDDLPLGGRAKNDVWWIATQMNFDPIAIGVEYLDWETEYVGFDDGDARRLAFYLTYSF